MKRTYKVVTKPSTLSSRELAECLSKDGQLLLPLVELLERGEKAIDASALPTGLAPVSVRAGRTPRAEPAPGAVAPGREEVPEDSLANLS